MATRKLRLYIEEHEDRTLKRKARELGISEAELVRRAIDAAISTGAPGLARRPALDKLEEFLAEGDRVAARSTLLQPYRQGGLYGERGAPSRWF